MPSEAAEILIVAAAYDRRTIGEPDARAWALALDDLDPKACARAVVEHYRTSTDFVMPAHVRAIVASPDARQARLTEWRLRHGIAAYIAGDTEEEYAARVQAKRHLHAVEGGTQ